MTIDLIGFIILFIFLLLEKLLLTGIERLQSIVNWALCNLGQCLICQNPSLDKLKSISRCELKRKFLQTSLKTYPSLAAGVMFYIDMNFLFIMVRRSEMCLSLS